MDSRKRLAMACVDGSLACEQAFELAAEALKAEGFGS